MTRRIMESVSNGAATLIWALSMVVLLMGYVLTLPGLLLIMLSSAMRGEQ